MMRDDGDWRRGDATQAGEILLQTLAPEFGPWIRTQSRCRVERECRGLNSDPGKLQQLQVRRSFKQRLNASDAVLIIFNKDDEHTQLLQFLTGGAPQNNLLTDLRRKQVVNCCFLSHIREFSTQTAF